MMQFRANTLFYKNQINLFIFHAQFFHFMLFLLHINLFCGVWNQKGNFILRQIGVIHKRRVLSFQAKE